VHTDDFASAKNPIDWWPELIELVLKPMRADAPGRYRRYDWPTRRAVEWVEIRPVGPDC